MTVSRDILSFYVRFPQWDSCCVTTKNNWFYIAFANYICFKLCVKSLPEKTLFLIYNYISLFECALRTVNSFEIKYSTAGRFMASTLSCEKPIGNVPK